MSRRRGAVTKAPWRGVILATAKTRRRTVRSQRKNEYVEFVVINKGRCGYPGCRRSALLFCDEHAAEIRAVADAKQKRKRSRK